MPNIEKQISDDTLIKWNGKYLIIASSDCDEEYCAITLDELNEINKFIKEETNG